MAKEIIEELKPKNAKEGKGIAYAAIGIGGAAAIGLLGYGIYNNIAGITSSESKALNTCNSELQSISQLWTATMSKFVTQDAAANIPFPTATQSKTLAGITAQENAIMTGCVAKAVKAYNLDYIAVSAELIAAAVSISIIGIAGAKAYTYIKKKGYTKTPPKTPAGGNAQIYLGLLDYYYATGKIPASWVASGSASSSIKGFSGSLQDQVATYMNTVVEDEIITAAVAATVVASEIAMIEVDTAIAIAILA